MRCLGQILCEVEFLKEIEFCSFPLDLMHNVYYIIFIAIFGPWHPACTMLILATTHTLIFGTRDSWSKALIKAISCSATGAPY